MSAESSQLGEAGLTVQGKVIGTVCRSAPLPERHSFMSVFDTPMGDAELSELLDIHQEVFESWRPRLMALAYQRVGSSEEAEDIISEAWLRWFSATNVRNHGAFLATVVLRLCADHLKSAHARRVCYVGALVPEGVVQPETAAHQPFRHVELEDELRRGVTWLLERLGPAERGVLVLRRAFEYRYQEIAAVLGISETYCRKLYARAHDRLSAGRCRFVALPTEHAELTRRLLAASRNGELRPLENLLAAALAA